jgi:hypothetical protein
MFIASFVTGVKLTFWDADCFQMWMKLTKIPENYGVHMLIASLNTCYKLHVLVLEIRWLQERRKFYDVFLVFENRGCLVIDVLS